MGKEILEFLEKIERKYLVSMLLGGFVPGLIIILVYKFELFVSLDILKVLLLCIAVGIVNFAISFVASIFVVFGAMTKQGRDAKSEEQQKTDVLAWSVIISNVGLFLTIIFNEKIASIRKIILTMGSRTAAFGIAVIIITCLVKKN